MKQPFRSFVLFAVLWAAAWLAAGCSRTPAADSRSSNPPLQVEEATDVDMLTVAQPDQFPLVTVESRKMREELRVNGVVAPDVNRTVPVNSLTAGRVVEIRARLGDTVQKGKVLLTLHTPDVALAISDMRKFEADEVLARKSLERAQTLYAKGAIAQKDLQVAEDIEQKARVDVQTARERIRIFGGSLEKPSPVIEIKAPISGTIIEQNITGGAGVKSLDNSPNLFTIADLSRIWVLCDVYENNLAQVRLGDQADVRLPAYPDRVLRGRVSNIGRILDPATRSAKVRLELENPRGELRPGMFATVVFIAQSSQEFLVVPSKAILRLHDRDWVFRPDGGTRFRRIPIQAGPATSDGFQRVLSGLPSGERVVSNALQFASSAERK